MIRLAFFWIGDNIDIPQQYVNSIRLFHLNDIEVIQLSDFQTSCISGVDKVLRADLSHDIMKARLQAYSLLEFNDDYTLFTDADCLLIQPIKLIYSDDILLLKRTDNFIINSNYPEHYPEFVGKMILDVMPYLFGAICIKNPSNNNFFDTLLSILEKLPRRFHRWYGDQVSLSNAANTNNLFSFGYLDSEIHLKIMSFIPSKLDILIMRNSGTQIITFKGFSEFDVERVEKLDNLKLTLNNIQMLK